MREGFILSPWGIFRRTLIVGALILAATWFLPDRAFADACPDNHTVDWLESAERNAVEIKEITKADTVSIMELLSANDIVTDDIVAIWKDGDYDLVFFGKRGTWFSFVAFKDDCADPGLQASGHIRQTSILLTVWEKIGQPVGDPV